VVDRSNLQRQILHGTADVGRSKLDSAKDRLADINPHVKLEMHETRLTSENAMEILRGYDVVADGTDNFPTRYLINDACVLLGIPNVYGSIFRFEGQASVFHFEGGPCYRCLYPEPPPPGLVPSCAEGGVLGILPGMIGVIQATETIKILLGKGETLSGRLLLYDALRMKFREMKLKRSAGCSVCGDHPTIRSLIDYEQFCGLPGPAADSETNVEIYRMVNELLGERAPGTDQAGSGEPGIVPPGDMSVQQLQERIAAADDSFLLLDVREPHETRICSLPGSTMIPMNDIPDRLSELDPGREIVCFCRTGIRSAQVAMYLAHRNFPRTWNLVGGIHRWAEEIDPEMPVY